MRIKAKLFALVLLVPGLAQAALNPKVRLS